MSNKKKIEPPKILKTLANQCGIEFNGQNTWDIQVYDAEVYRRILMTGSLGFGESYIDGLWECDDLSNMFVQILNAKVDETFSGKNKLLLWSLALRQRLLNLQSRHRAFQIGERHYDIGNDLFQAMLDSSMAYSCAYWEQAQNLEEAQRHKLDMVCRKLELKAGEKLLDIGCGWGSLSRFAAENYGVEVLGITVSKEQKKLAEEVCKGLPVKIELIDYRDLQGKFDKIASIGMFEHVGRKNYGVFFQKVAELLDDQGLFLLHTIGIYKTKSNIDLWIDKYIFPNGKLPSAKEIASVIDEVFLIEDWHNFGTDYATTLMAWWKNFQAAWPKLKKEYDDSFYRMWKYYLFCCAGFFTSKQGRLWQLVLSKLERKQVYHSVR